MLGEYQAHTDIGGKMSNIKKFNVFVEKLTIETCEIEMCGEVAIYISPDGLKMCGDCKQKDMNITCNSPGDYKSIDLPIP